MAEKPRVVQSAPVGRAIHSSAASFLREAGQGAQFVAQAAGLFRAPPTSAEAHAELARRRATRPASLLHVLRRAVYDHSPSPYRALLAAAGVEYGDVARLVAADGVDATLRTLARAGVYLTLDELKGRRPVLRGSVTLHVAPGTLVNPLAGAGAPARTGGSSGRPSAVVVPAGAARAAGIAYRLIFEAQGASTWPKAIWWVPGGSALLGLLNLVAAGPVPERWFSQVPADASGLHARYRASVWGVRLAARLGGRSLAAPVYVPPIEPAPVVQWMADTLRAGRVPYLWTNVSAAVRACRWAAEHGVDLQGAQFGVGGEPLTQARLDLIRAAGGTVRPYYASMEANMIGDGCLAPHHVDDVHVWDDLNALIQPGPTAGTDGLFPDTLLLTSLQPVAPLVLLNASLGDVGVLERRDCGCPLAGLGWAQHLHTIRNPEKLTAAGMTFLDADLARVLDEVLPARFGGGPTDYQLVEEETPDGQARLRLLVSPSVGAVDLPAAAAVFLDAISTGSGVERVMGTVWRTGGLLRAEQRPPQVGFSGKILHLYRAGARPDGPRPGS